MQIPTGSIPIPERHRSNCVSVAFPRLKIAPMHIRSKFETICVKTWSWRTNYQSTLTCNFAHKQPLPLLIPRDQRWSPVGPAYRAFGVLLSRQSVFVHLIHPITGLTCRITRFIPTVILPAVEDFHFQFIPTGSGSGQTEFRCYQFLLLVRRTPIPRSSS
jgi:hypothetical protein